MNGNVFYKAKQISSDDALKFGTWKPTKNNNNNKNDETNPAPV